MTLENDLQMVGFSTSMLVYRRVTCEPYHLGGMLLYLFGGVHSYVKITTSPTAIGATKFSGIMTDGFEHAHYMPDVLVLSTRNSEHLQLGAT